MDIRYGSEKGTVGIKLDNSGTFIRPFFLVAEQEVLMCKTYVPVTVIYSNVYGVWLRKILKESINCCNTKVLKSITWCYHGQFV